jgi:hypothetical protein
MNAGGVHRQQSEQRLQRKQTMGFSLHRQSNSTSWTRFLLFPSWPSAGLTFTGFRQHPQVSVMVIPKNKNPWSLSAKGGAPGAISFFVIREI